MTTAGILLASDFGVRQHSSSKTASFVESCCGFGVWILTAGSDRMRVGRSWHKSRPVVAMVVCMYGCVGVCVEEIRYGDRDDG